MEEEEANWGIESAIGFVVRGSEEESISVAVTTVVEEASGASSSSIEPSAE